MDQNYDQNNKNSEEKKFSQQRRSIRDVRIGNNELRRRTPRTVKRARGGGAKKNYHHRGIGAGKYFIAFFVLLIFAFGGIIATTYFSQATITVVPRSEIILVDEEITLSNEDTGATALSYDIFSVDEIGTEVVLAESSEMIERRARGEITIYNTTDSSGEPLIANTRFESTDGNIYRISDSVVVPGVESTGSPGKITVPVVSDNPGEEYNLAAGRLTIPGLRGTDLYGTMYAEVENAIEGGLIGEVNTISEESEEAARNKTQALLREGILQEKVKDTLPQDYLIIPGSTFVEFEELTNQSESDKVVVRTRGTLYGVMLKRDLFASYIANQYVENYDNKQLSITNPEELSYDFASDNLSFSDIQDDVTIDITGQAALEWVVDEESIKQAVSGIPKSQFVDIISATSGVQDARLELVPSFMRKIPSSVEKVTVIVQNNL